MNHTIKKIYNNLSSDNYLSCSTISFFLILGYFFIGWPIAGYDTDLWYHLSGGRYFWEHQSIAYDSFFSYITPSKSWHNYYWLFQIIVYKIFNFAGYYGLIILRCVIYLTTVFLIYCFFIKDIKNTEEDNTLLIANVFLFICCSIALTFRELLVRPHLFSYLFIIVFLFILEKKPNKIFLLPFIGIIWVNIHGIEYPVMILIALSYLFEIYFNELRKITTCPLFKNKSKWFLIFTAYTIFLTPNFIELLKVPFNNAQYQSLYVAELISTNLYDVFNFQIFPLSDVIPVFQKIVILASITAFLVCIFKRRLRVSHLLLFVGSSLLLLKHVRFVMEFILLSIPMIHYTISFITREIHCDKKKLGIIFPLVLIVIPCIAYGNFFKNKPAYPLTQQSLPVGISSFLNHVNVGGNILNEPNTGGYLQWSLNKKYKIFMDMQLSLFEDKEHFTATNALSDKTTFKYFIKKYNPSFISVSLKRNGFRGMMKDFDHFIPIFFDDTEILYANKQHFKDLVDRYELKHANPFDYKNIPYESMTQENASLLLGELMRMNDIYPSIGIVDTMIFHILMKRKEYEAALIYSEDVIKNYPDAYTGYALKAEAFFELNKLEDAVYFNKVALRKGQKPDTEGVYRNLYATYNKLKEYREAYKILSELINPFDVNTHYKDIYELGLSAASAGKRQDAITFLALAEIKIPPNESQMLAKIKEVQSNLNRK